MLLRCKVHAETLHVDLSLLLPIVEKQCPNLGCVQFLYYENVLLIVVVEVEIRDVYLTIVKHHKDSIVIVELAKILSVLVIVEAQHIRVKPNVAPVKSGMAARLQGYAVNGCL